MTGRKTLGQVIKERRTAMKVSRPELMRRMGELGFHLPYNTLETWELPSGHRRAGKNKNIWNPEFLTALAEALDTTELHLLNDMGFGVLPEGYSRANIELVDRLRAIEPDRQEEIIDRILDLLNTLDKSS